MQYMRAHCHHPRALSLSLTSSNNNHTILICAPDYWSSSLMNKALQGSVLNPPMSSGWTGASMMIALQGSPETLILKLQALDLHLGSFEFL